MWSGPQWLRSEIAPMAASTGPFASSRSPSVLRSQQPGRPSAIQPPLALGTAGAPTDPIEELRHAIDLVVVLPIREGQQFALEGRQPVGLPDLTTELARVLGLFVISRNAALTYKGKAMQPAQIANELGVRYILEGSAGRARTCASTRN
jgi:hypothetical protein